MAKATAQEFVDIIKMAGYEPRSYSGRGMFGEYCVSVNLGRGQVAEFGRDVSDRAEADGVDVSELVSHYSQDSMGLGVVLYWRSLKADGVRFPKCGDDDED